MKRTVDPPNEQESNRIAEMSKQLVSLATTPKVGGRKCRFLVCRWCGLTGPTGTIRKHYGRCPFRTAWRYPGARDASPSEVANILKAIELERVQGVIITEQSTIKPAKQ